jgi:hypothetical protein
MNQSIHAKNAMNLIFEMQSSENRRFYHLEPCPQTNNTIF